MEGVLVGDRRMRDITFSAYLRSACCNVPMYSFRVEEMCVRMNSCAGCDAILGTPEDWDMALIGGDMLPRVNEMLENLTFVDLETGPQTFRTITVY